MAVFIENDQAQVEVIENPSPTEFAELVETYREKDDEYVIKDLRRAYGKVVVARVRSADDRTVLANDRRERIYDATNRILEHSHGVADEAFAKVEDAVDDILSTCGVPDRVVA